VSLADSEEVRILDNGYIDMREFLSRMVEELVEEIVLDNDVRYPGDADDTCVPHVSLSMIIAKVAVEIDEENPDCVDDFLSIVQVHCQEMLVGGRLVRTHEGDYDLGDETCVRLPSDSDLDQ